MTQFYEHFRLAILNRGIVYTVGFEVSLLEMSVEVFEAFEDRVTGIIVLWSKIEGVGKFYFFLATSAFAARSGGVYTTTF